MKNPDMVLYRAAIGQILADAGITRSTIQEMVREVIQEKVEKQFRNVAQEEMNKYNFKSNVERQFTDALRYAVRQELSNMLVSISVTDRRTEDGK